MKTQEPNQYIELSDLRAIMSLLSDMYPDKFSVLPEDRVKCFAITNKSRAAKKVKYWEMYPVPKPVNEIVGIDIAIVVFLDDWASMTEGQRSLLAADVMMTIKQNDGKLSFVSFDVQDHSDMIRNFGLEYLNNPEAPDITRSNYLWS
jgi:hypothetical protein